MPGKLFSRHSNLTSFKIFNDFCTVTFLEGGKREGDNEAGQFLLKNYRKKLFYLEISIIILFQEGVILWIENTILKSDKKSETEQE